MKLTRKNKQKSEISTSSLPDIIFMLLIFFMVTTVMREFEGLDIVLPRAEKIEKLESKRHTVHMWITKDGLISVNDNVTFSYVSASTLLYVAAAKFTVWLLTSPAVVVKGTKTVVGVIQAIPGLFTKIENSLSLDSVFCGSVALIPNV